MYADDSNGQLANLSTYSTTAGGALTAVGSSPYGVPWRTDIFNNQMSPAANKTTQGGWLAALIQGYQDPTPGLHGGIYPYAPNPNIMHCPADPRYGQRFSPNGTGPGGSDGPWTYESYSTDRYLNGEAHGGDPNCLFQISSAQFLHPSDRFVWTELNDNRGENVGSMAFNVSGNQANGFAGSTFADQYDVPGIFHIANGCFNYGDSHADSHPWANATALVQFATTGTGTPAPADAMWVAQHLAGNQNP